jgi:ketosteroid isomerase-like protein
MAEESTTPDLVEITRRGVDAVNRRDFDTLMSYAAPPAPDGRVVSLFWQRGKGRQSGLSMLVEWALITSTRGDRIERIETYDDRAEAVRAAGLTH